MTEYIDPGYHLLWLDLETTGLDPIDDAILEVGLVLTDLSLNVIDSMSRITPTTYAKVRLRDMRRYVEMGEASENDLAVLGMHTDNGLIHEIESAEAKSMLEIDGEFRKWLKDMGIKSGTFPMTGNSVHFDRAFLTESGKGLILHDVFHYRNIDVSTIKETMKRYAPGAQKVIEDKLRAQAARKHRVLDDLSNSIAEYKAYLDFLELY